MTGQATWRASIDRMYSDEVERHYEDADASIALGESLQPRSAAMLLDVVQELELGGQDRVLDVGCRDGRHIVELRKRFGCDVVGVEPASGNLLRMKRTQPAAAPPVAQGIAEQLPFGAGAFDMVWVRDVLVHVPALDEALKEIRRVLADKGAVVIYHTLATKHFGRADADLVCEPAGIWSPNLDRVGFEAAVHNAGFSIERNHRIGGEWIEHNVERDGDGQERLLSVARLLRHSDHYRGLLGDLIYEVELGDRLYSMFQLLGKLEANVYVLRSSGTPGR